MSSEKICFIASTIGEDGSEERRIADDKFDLVFEPILDEMGYKAVRADKIGTPNSISNDIVKAILESELMIADVSDLNPNVFYELAVRNAIQKPVLVIKGKDQKMPFDIYDKRAITIDMKDARLWTEAKDHLKNQIGESEKDTESASKSILSNFTLKTELQSEINPSDELSLEMKDIKSEIRRLREDVKEGKDTKREEIFWGDYISKKPLTLRKDRGVELMQLFMDILKDLEGDKKIPVEESRLVTELIATRRFNSDSARDMIRNMLREASIYESKPRHYNRV